MREKLVAIAPFVRSCPRVVTLGVQTSMGDYTPAQRRMLLCASQILFPTPRFAGILHAAGKRTFPSAISYSILRSRLIQEVLFQLLKCPRPFTRIYYGRQKNSILEDFSFPFRAMGPKMPGSALRVCDNIELKALAEIYNPLIVQESLDYQDRFLLIFVNYQCIGILGKISGGEQDGFKENIARDCFNGEIVSYLENLFRSVQINDVAAQIGIIRGGCRVIELARPPLWRPTPEGAINRFDYISHMIESNMF
ncbi:hypothetical protein SBDP1_160012 [Syntrophobacter sp. SbD1]|nr:hypothetical protein SBDP1_160012 [Syntrophobacter sp. SbD1]